MQHGQIDAVRDHVDAVAGRSGEDGPEQFFRWIGFEVVGETQYGENIGALTL